MKFRTVFISSLLLLLALGIYLSYRPEDTLACRLVSMTFLGDYLMQFRTMLSSATVPHAFIIYSLPGALWMFSTTLLSKNLQVTIRNKTLPLMHLPIMYGLSAEFMQLFHITDGTFDWADLSSVSAAWLLAALPFTTKSSSTISRLKIFPAFCVAFSYAILILADTFSF